ncbi:MAG: tetratricopeptide repeat protein [Capsulimonadaceae bacterium]
MQELRKVVLAPFGADDFGADILLFEHGLFFGLEMACEAADLAFADVHQQLGGDEKKSSVTPALTETEIRRLAERAACDALVDGMLLCTRDDGALAEIAVALRVYDPHFESFHTPDALVFRAFEPGAGGVLAIDFDYYIALQYRLCEEIFAAVNLELPESFTCDSLQITHDWEAYSLFVRGKRGTGIAEEKLGYYEQAVRRDPNFYLALYNSAMLHKTRTDYNTARMRLMRAAAATHDPGLLGEVYFDLGLCSIYLGDTKTARNYWEKALEFGIDNPSLLINMAGTYEQEEKWEEAKQINQLVVDRFPTYHKAIVNLARLHAMLGRLDLAIPLYEQALELQPGDALRSSVLGGCYLAVGRNADARLLFERSVSLDPDGDPGKYAAQELAKLGPTGSSTEPSQDNSGDKRKRWGLW